MFIVDRLLSWPQYAGNPLVDSLKPPDIRLAFIQFKALCIWMQLSLADVVHIKERMLLYETCIISLSAILCLESIKGLSWTSCVSCSFTTVCLKKDENSCSTNSCHNRKRYASRLSSHTFWRYSQYWRIESAPTLTAHAAFHQNWVRGHRYHSPKKSGFMGYGMSSTALE